MKKRLLLKTILYLSFSIILSKLFIMQVMKQNYYYEKLSSRNNKIVYGDTTLRGRIYDMNNKLLVDNIEVLTIVYQNKDNLSTSEEIELAYKISNFIELDINKLTNSYLKDYFILTNEDLINKRVINDIKLYNERKISKNELYQRKKESVLDSDLDKYTDLNKKAIYLYYLMHNGYSYDEKIIKENCSLEEYLYFSENSHNLNGFKTKINYQRKYIYQDTLKGIFGSVGSIPSEKKDYYLSRGYNLSDKVGLTNLELMYDEYLKGNRNIYKIVNGDKILVREGSRGNDLYLTIDIDIQKEIDNILSNEVLKASQSNNSKYYKHSYVLVSDTTGSIIAISGKEKNNKKIIDVGIGNILDTITPGSVVKAASMLTGFDTGAIKIGEVMKDECLKIKSTPLKCSISTMGNINDINALAYSSNVYQFKTAIKIGKGTYKYNQPLIINKEAFDIYREHFGRFGLGVSTGIDLPKESLGYKGSKEDAGLLLDFAIGQYDTYTNMQLNQYISTIAQNGNRYKMHLLKEIKNNNEVILEYHDEILNNINIDEKYINRVKKGLEAVISYGTGKSYTKVPSAAKTGTSESFYDSDGDGIIDKETISTSFVMYMPKNDPIYAISITSPNIGLNNGYKYPINKNVINEVTNFLVQKHKNIF